MHAIIEQYQEEIRQQSIDELRELMPEVLTSEEYEQMYDHGLQGVVVVLEELGKLNDFSSLVQSFPSLSKEDMRLIDMHLQLVTGYIQTPRNAVVVSEDIDVTQQKVIVTEDMNLTIVAAIAAAIALIIKFWDRIFAFLFSPTESSKKMAKNADSMEKDLKALNVKSYANATTKGKSPEVVAAYKAGKFISSSAFLYKYGKNGKGPYTIKQVIDAYDNYDSIAKEGGFVDKVVDTLYQLAAFYMSDNFYKLLESIVVEIEKANKANPGSLNVSLKEADEAITSLLLKYITTEAAAYGTLLSNFPTKKTSGEKETEYRVSKEHSYGIFKGLVIYVKVNQLSLINSETPGGMTYRSINSSLPSDSLEQDFIRVELPGPDERGAVTEKYLERFNASYDDNNGEFSYSGFSKHSEFQKGNFKTTMEKHGKKLKKLATRVGAIQTNHQAKVMNILINASRNNVGGILAIVNKIFSDTYQKDIKIAEKLINEVRSHDRETSTTS